MARLQQLLTKATTANHITTSCNKVTTKYQNNQGATANTAKARVAKATTANSVNLPHQLILQQGYTG